MLLLIDAGNTRIKWAVVNPTDPSTPLNTQLGKWCATGWLTHQELFAATVPPWNTFSIQRAVISNVAGQLVHKQILQLLTTPSVEWLTSLTTFEGPVTLTNQYRVPSQL